MTVELWYGKKPDNPAEQNILLDLYDFLREQPEHFVVLSTFFAGRSHEIDLAVFKRNAWFVAEVKHVWGKVVGDKNGEWKCLDAESNVQKTLRNPFLQVRGSYAGLRDWTAEHRAKIRSAPGKEIDLKALKPIEYIVLYPRIPPGSEISIGNFPVETIELDKLRAALVMRSIPGFDFSLEELQTIPGLLNLTQWHIDSASQSVAMPRGNPPPAATAPSLAELPADERRITKTSLADYQRPMVRMLVARSADYAPMVFHITKSITIVGREPDCDLVINHESVSRKHAEIRLEKGRWIVRDFGSRNGVFVSYNGDPQSERRIERFNAIKNGSIIRFGQASFTFLLSEER